MMHITQHRHQCEQRLLSWQDTGLRKEKWVVLADMLELGGEEQVYHESLADELVAMELEGILLYGPRMKWLHDKLQNTRH